MSLLSAIDYLLPYVLSTVCTGTILFLFSRFAFSRYIFSLALCFGRTTEEVAPPDHEVCAFFAAAAPTAFALQSNYLSQLNGGSSQMTGSSFFPPPTQTVPSAETIASVGGPSAELLDLWSSQVSVELAASQLYLSASIWFRGREMNGMAAWMLDELF